VNLFAWVQLALAALVPTAITRGPIITQLSAHTAVISWIANRPGPVTVRIDGRAYQATGQVRVGGLRSGVRYRFDLHQAGRILTRGSLRTDPGVTGSFTAAVFGDYGEGSTAETRVARLAASWRPDLTVSTGDNVYLFAAGGAWIDSHMLTPLRPLLDQSGFVMALGNHDTFGDNGAALLAAMALPGARRYYVERYGPVAFVVIDSDSPVTPESPQGVFLRTVARQTAGACLRIAVFHHPPFAPYSGVIGQALRRYVVPVLTADRFALVLDGHVHAYERSAAYRGVTYVTVGTGGAVIGRYAAATIPDATRIVGTYGALRLVVNGRVARGVFFDTAGTARDRFTVGC
jgi:hypothetical protein